MSRASRAAARVEPLARPARGRPPQKSAGAETAGIDNPSPAPGAIAGGYDIKTSLPDSIDRHDVSDEQLTMLVDPRRDSLSEQKWAFFGIAGGAAPGAIGALWSYYQTSEISGIDFFQVLLFVTFLALALWTRKTDNRLARSPTDLAAEIRARTRMRVQSNEQK